ncbi:MULTISPECIES: GNAT family N-acetyltransferase [Nocardiopsis]|uniref:GNAT family N-acetyltransferase n=2 Tax=Nocardiopsis alba TaxID=53437 RepID=A0A7K2IM18_9ACTN|nr:MULTISPECIES: GNAT family N-acetyltransferase [Nocardiopsis]AFR09406.1 acetyltransferase family protein [Nocardiopsis alba ATCC BAA-2165]MEC3894538.1 GNAT family N-acetyltransferase [Nocardiopsis sp. LDBS1602]MYR31022.1 GNAT family N-acetyltransferase [Nocardiopsis alba]
MATEVTDVPDRRRYEITSDGELAGFAEYIPTGDMLTFTHTEIDPAFEGKGLGGTLVREALDDVRARGLSILPMCPFVRDWIGRHRDYVDLVYRSSGE